MSSALNPEQWRTMETSPKDGSRILIFDEAIFIASWDDNAVFEIGENDIRPGWVIFDCEDPYYSFSLDDPSHWMPLPEAPK